MYFVYTTTGFLPLLLSVYSPHYISVEKINILIVRYKLLLKTATLMHGMAVFPMGKNPFVCTLHESTFTYLTLYIHFLWHPSVTGIGEITYAQDSEVTGVLTVPLHLQVQAWASQRTSLSSAVFFLKNQFKQNVLLHKNMLFMYYVACRNTFCLPAM